MSGLAEILLRAGYAVSGSDLRLSPITNRLRELGARIAEGHAAENLGEAKVLVATSAVDAANPEVVEARRRGIPVVTRGELLAEVMRGRFGIAVAGSHGKTSTTSMIATMLCQAGLDPTVLVGGNLSTLGGSNARLGASRYMVAETDESDGSFLRLSPIIAVITNIDREHLDFYPSLEAIRAAFLEFANKQPFYGAVIACLDDENVREILPSVRSRAITYGRTEEADLIVTGVRCGHFESEFDARSLGRELGRFRVLVPGAHNVLNAAAAIAVGLELELDPEQIRAGLAEYRGVDRRFQVRGHEAGVTVIDDYGHHPTEIRATLAAARLCDFGRVHMIFQPHRYTRTRALFEEFATCFEEADSVTLLDIYEASEKPIAGVTAERLAERIRATGPAPVTYAGTMQNAAEALRLAVKPGDAVITQGAGNVWQAGDLLLQALREER